VLDGGAGLESAIAAVWDDVPVQRCTVHKHRNLLAHAPERLHEESGSLGVGRVARAAPDGYTLVVGYWGTHVANGAVYELKYDVLNDFEPVSLVATQPFLIVAKKTMPAWVPRTTSVALYSRTSLAPAFSSCLTAAPDRRCKTWSLARSTSCLRVRP